MRSGSSMDTTASRVLCYSSACGMRSGSGMDTTASRMFRHRSACGVGSTGSVTGAYNV